MLCSVELCRAISLQKVPVILYPRSNPHPNVTDLYPNHFISHWSLPLTMSVSIEVMSIGCGHMVWHRKATRRLELQVVSFERSVA